MNTHASTLVAILGLAVATPAGAQQRSERFAVDPLPAAITLDAVEHRSTVRLATAGAIGGLALAAAGGAAGALIGCVNSDRNGSEDFCALVAIPGIVLGQAIGVPLGVHIANDREGSGLAVFATSFASLLVGGGALILAGDAAWAALPLVPILQIAATVAVERATEDRY